MSDEDVVQRWIENPYWQHFSGEPYFRHELPCDPSSLVRWRQRIGEEGCEWLLEHCIKAAMSAGVVAQCEQVTEWLPRQGGNVSLSNLQVLNAILGVAEHGCKLARPAQALWQLAHDLHAHGRWAKSGVLDRAFELSASPLAAGAPRSTSSRRARARP